MPLPHLAEAVHVGRWLEHLSPLSDYAILFGMTLVEGTGMPAVPFEPIFVAVGYLIGRDRLAYLPAILAGASGNLAGNLVGYLVGMWLGAYFFSGAAQRFGVTAERLALAQRWFER